MPTPSFKGAPKHANSTAYLTIGRPPKPTPQSSQFLIVVSIVWRVERLARLDLGFFVGWRLNLLTIFRCLLELLHGGLVVFLPSSESGSSLNRISVSALVYVSIRKREEQGGAVPTLLQ